MAQEFSLEAYNTAFKYPEKVIRAYGITVSITVLGTFLSLLFTSMCGYALQREDFRSRGFFTMFVFFTMLFGGGLVKRKHIFAHLVTVEFFLMVHPSC